MTPPSSESSSGGLMIEREPAPTSDSTWLRNASQEANPYSSRDGALRIPETAKLGVTPKQFLGLTLELIEMGTRGQRPSRHTDLLPKLAWGPPTGRKKVERGCPKTGGLSPWRTTAPCGDRRRIVRLFLTESLLVSLLAAALGVGIARLSLRVLLSVNPPLPVGREIELSLWVLGFAIALAVLTGVIVGLYPSSQAARTDVVAALNEGGRGARVTHGQQRFRMTLVGGQVALSFVLLAGALLLLTSVVKLQRQDTGFTPASVLVGRLNLPTARYSDKARQAIFTDGLIETLRHRPGIRNAAVAIGVPLTGATILGPASAPATSSSSLRSGR